MVVDDTIQSLHSELSLTGVVVQPPLGLEINKLDERSAMGLSHSNLAPELTEVLTRTAALKHLEIEQLAELVEDENQPFIDRYAAGKLLCLLGDPRISTFNPVTCTLPKGNYSIGLEPKNIDEIVAEFASYGVLRQWIEKECPRHSVPIKRVNIGKYPVTHCEFHRFVIDTGYTPTPSAWRFGVMPEELSNHPVNSINPDDAEAYATWLAAKTGRLFRLPSEAEWEAAAAGPNRRKYPWGMEFLADHANTVESGILHTTPVGMFPKGASHIGCLDMGGNAEEYVADDYQAYPGGKTIHDDLTLSNGRYRVARGGSCTRYRDLARCKRRHGRYQKTIYIMGFRLAEDI